MNKLLTLVLLTLSLSAFADISVVGNNASAGGSVQADNGNATGAYGGNASSAGQRTDQQVNNTSNVKNDYPRVSVASSFAIPTTNYNECFVPVAVSGNLFIISGAYSGVKEVPGCLGTKSVAFVATVLNDPASAAEQYCAVNEEYRLSRERQGKPCAYKVQLIPGTGIPGK